MLELRFADTEGIPPCPSLDRPEVERWRDAAGNLAAYAVSTEGRYWVVIPEIATFCFGQDATEAVVVTEPRASTDSVRDLYCRVVLPVALQALGCEALHASGVLSDHGVFAFCGESGVGKSTLAFALARRGHALWADDTVVLEMRGRRVLAVPMPFRPRLRPQVATFLGLDGTPAADDAAARDLAPLAAVFVLERVRVPVAESPMRLARLAAAEAFVATLRHANCFSWKESAPKRRVVSNYLRLVASVPIFRLRIASGLDRLDQVAEAVAAALGRPDARSVAGMLVAGRA